MNKIKTLQQNNRKDIEQLETQVGQLEKELADKLKQLEAKELLSTGLEGALGGEAKI